MKHKGSIQQNILGMASKYLTLVDSVDTGTLVTWKSTVELQCSLDNGNI